jgi:hypothetical protein
MQLLVCEFGKYIFSCIKCLYFMKTNFIDLDPEIKQFKELCLEMSQERRLTCHFFLWRNLKITIPIKVGLDSASSLTCRSGPALYIDFASTSKCFYSLMLRVHGRVANTNLIVLGVFFTRTGKSPTIYTNIGEQANISQRLLYLLKKKCLMETKWLFIDVILSIDFNIHFFFFVNSNIQLWLELLLCWTRATCQWASTI